MGHHEHLKLAQQKLKCAVVTFSDTRNKQTDKSGKIIIEQLEKEGHKLVEYFIVKENPAEIKAVCEKLLAHSEVDALVTNGGTGLSGRDSTIEVIRPLLDKELEGFGEIFRFVSFQQIGSAAIMSRATAGIANKKAVFCLPGASKAVKLAMSRIILQQLAHVIFEARR
jgi:molybdenum cofactor biosynthesis protein B